MSKEVSRVSEETKQQAKDIADVILDSNVPDTNDVTYSEEEVKSLLDKFAYDVCGNGMLVQINKKPPFISCSNDWFEKNKKKQGLPSTTDFSDKVESNKIIYYCPVCGRLLAFNKNLPKDDMFMKALQVFHWHPVFQTPCREELVVISEKEALEILNKDS